MFKIHKNKQTDIWELLENGVPRMFSGDPNGGNVQALVTMIMGVYNAAKVPVKFQLEVLEG